MAHFAELDSNNIVLRVVVINNPDTADANGVEKEYIGAAFCERLFGGTWKQTSYNANFRKNYAGIGYTYRADLDAFVAPQPDPKCMFNEDTCQWVCPPEDGNTYTWNDVTKAFDLVTP